MDKRILPAVSRDAALDLGRTRAIAFGESNPTPIDAAIMTLVEAQRKVFPEGGPIDGPVEGQSVAPSHTRVWLVRMRGAFKAPHGPRPSCWRTHGWMYAIVEVETGRTISSGFRSDAMPVR